MTWTDVTAPPLLLLPSKPLNDAADALSQAKRTLRQAEKAEWVSVAASNYQAELVELAARLDSLVGMVDDCQHEWRRARIAAWGAGQL